MARGSSFPEALFQFRRCCKGPLERHLLVEDHADAIESASGSFDRRASASVFPDRRSGTDKTYRPSQLPAGL